VQAISGSCGVSRLALIAMRTGRFSASSCPAGIWRGAGPGASFGGTQPGQPGGQPGLPVRDRAGCHHYLPETSVSRPAPDRGSGPDASRWPQARWMRTVSGVWPA